MQTVQRDLGSECKSHLEFLVRGKEAHQPSLLNKQERFLSNPARMRDLEDYEPVP